MSYISEIRKLVGHRPIMSAAVVCILYDEKKGLLFEKRTDTGEWCVPGGALELGEEPEDGLFREVKEETNLDIEDPELFHDEESVDLRWFGIDELPDNIMPTQTGYLEEFIRRIKT